jgi:hypothetical protein
MLTRPSRQDQRVCNLRWQLGLESDAKTRMCTSSNSNLILAYSKLYSVVYSPMVPEGQRRSTKRPGAQGIRANSNFYTSTEIGAVFGPPADSFDSGRTPNIALSKSEELGRWCRS